MRWYYDANPRGRERLWGTALVASGGRSTDIVEESGTTVYDLHDVACTRTHLGNVDRLTSTYTIPYYGLLISHRLSAQWPLQGTPGGRLRHLWANFVTAPP